jgi:hypothetical protein
LKAAALATAEVTAGSTFDQVQAAEQSSGADAYVDTNPLIAPNRVFAKYVRCRAGEPCAVLAPSGYDAARAPDGIHLCPATPQPVNGVVPVGCAVWSTSQQRFADEVAAVK